MKVRFIINPIAGGSSKVDEVTDSVRRVLNSAEGIFEIRITGKKGDGCSLSKEAVEKRYDFVFACGGDGTVNEVATPLVNSGTALGIIQAGSGNGLARALNLPKDVESSIKLLTEGKVKEIDVGTVDSRCFFSTAGFGLDATLSKRYDERRSARTRRGILPYFPMALMEFLRYRPEPLVIKANDKYMRLAPLILTVANTEQFGADAVIAPGARPDDGLLDLCVIPRTDLLDALWIAFKILRGKVDTFRAYRRIRTDSAEVRRKAPGTIHVDGEPFEGGERVMIKVLPKALRVLVN